jgi:hypothetical protein
LKALAVIFLLFTLLALGALHSAHKSAYIVVHRGQPLPKHYIEAWSFGNVTIVQVAPDNTTVTLAPWS